MPEPNYRQSLVKSLKYQVMPSGGISEWEVELGNGITLTGNLRKDLLEESSIQEIHSFLHLLRERYGAGYIARLLPDGRLFLVIQTELLAWFLWLLTQQEMDLEPGAWWTAPDDLISWALRLFDISVTPTEPKDTKSPAELSEEIMTSKTPSSDGTGK